MTFLQPLFLLLLVIPFVVGRFPVNRQTAGALSVPYALAHHWRTGAAKGVSRRKWLILLWVLLVIAVARPAVPRGTPVLPTEARDIVLAIDLSASMEREDFELDGEKASRIEIVRRVAAEFVGSLQSDRVGLVFFADAAYIGAPLGFDMVANATLITEARIGLAGRSTAIGDAIGQSIKAFGNASDEKSRVIILLSDGTNNSGAVSPIQAAHFAERSGITVYTIGLASDAFTNSLGAQRAANYDLDENTLRRIASITGGNYFRVRTTDELTGVYARLAELERREVDAPPLVHYTELNWPFVLGALLILFHVSGALRWSR